MEMDWTITEFDDAIDYVIELIGSNFKKALEQTNAILEDPQSFTGAQASMAAMKLAAHRTKVGVVAQHWKLKSANTKKPHDRLIKDSLLVLYDGLLELINTLKAVARYEREVV